MNRSHILILAALLVLVSILAPGGASAGPTCTTQTAAFGWEANRLHNNGANLTLPATATMHLTGITVDYAMTQPYKTRARGWREVLAYVTVDPTGIGANPYHAPQENGAAGWGADSRSGAASHGGGMTGDLFAQAILKNRYSGQLITEPLDLTLQAGDRLVVHAEAVGAPADVEAQGTVDYSECAS